MNIPNIKGLVNLGKTLAKAYRPELLFGASVTGTVVAVGLAAKGGYEARGRVEEAQNPTVDLSNPQNPLSTKEKAALTWSCYVPAGLATVGAVGSTTGLHLVHIKEKKQLAAAALVAIEEVKTSAKEYVADLQDAVEENTTPKTQNKIEKSFEEKQEARVGARDPLYYVRDARTGRSFLSTESRIQAAINEINNMLLNQKDVEVNTFYVWAGVPEVEGGDEHGWNAGEFVSLHWSDDHEPDGTPIREFSFSPRPQQGFDSYLPRGKGSR